MRLGLPAFNMIGLADKSVREARERVRGAIQNTGFVFPQQRIVVNLAPAYLRKEGPHFDLPLAIAVLAASGQIDPAALEEYAFIGELSITGDVSPVRGALAVAEGARRAGLTKLMVPASRAGEGALVDGVEALGVQSLPHAVAVLRGEADPLAIDPAPSEDAGTAEDVRRSRGCARARRSPGGSRRGGGGRPQPVHARAAGHREDHARAAAADAAAAPDARGGGRGHAHPLDRGHAPRQRPHRRAAVPRAAPRDLAVRPGRRRSDAHAGRDHPRAPWRPVPRRAREFNRNALEALRQPLEDGRVVVVRAQRVLTFPTQAMLVAASNPCPCGLEEERCRCSAAERARHDRRLSGPLLDRIDITLHVGRPSAAGLRDDVAPSSATVRERVIAARAVQTARLCGTGAICNAQMTPAMLRELAEVTPSARRRLYELHDSEASDRARPPPGPSRRPHDRGPGGIGARRSGHIDAAAFLRTEPAAGLAA